ncbi:MAG TPA: hypothetical protein VNU97_03665, partial [Rhizomicrobium sp.]|nr:hypothetical protein [Rhizomicrobium sp.]
RSHLGSPQVLARSRACRLSLERLMPVTPDDNDDDNEFESVGHEIGDFVTERPFAALAIAVLIGFVFARTVF